MVNALGERGGPPGGVTMKEKKARLLKQRRGKEKKSLTA